MLVEKPVGLGQVTPKVQGGDQGNRHDFSITDPALSVFFMVKSFQKVVQKAENCYSLAVHVSLLVICGIGTYKFTRSHMDFSYSFLR